MSVRHVTASGWPYEYRAYIRRHDGWLRHGWKFVIEEKWVHWRWHKTSWRVYATEEQAQEAAHQWLDAKDGYRQEKAFVKRRPLPDRSET